MKKIVRLTESDLRRVIKRVIKENEDDYKDRSMYDPYYSDDLDKDMSAYELEQLMYEAMELMERYKQSEPFMSKKIETLGNFLREKLKG